jgi:hypothetical protein
MLDFKLVVHLNMEDSEQCPFRWIVNSAADFASFQFSVSESCGDLKKRLLTLPELSDTCDPACLRLAVIDSHGMPSVFLKDSTQQIKKANISTHGSLLVYQLGEPERIHPKFILLRAFIRDPVSRSYGPTHGIEVFIERNPSLMTLKKAMSEASGISVSNLTMASYRHNKYSWEVLEYPSSLVKRNKNKKPSVEIELGRLCDFSVVGLMDKSNPKAKSDNWMTFFDESMIALGTKSQLPKKKDVAEPILQIKVDI